MAAGPVLFIVNSIAVTEAAGNDHCRDSGIDRSTGENNSGRVSPISRSGSSQISNARAFLHDMPGICNLTRTNLVR